MQNQGVLVGLESANDGVYGPVPAAERVLDLTLDGEGMGDRGGRVVIEAGATAARVAAREVVGDQDEHAAPRADHAMDMAGEHFSEVGPAQVEHAAQIAERLDDAERRAGDDRQVDAPVHALHDCDRGRVPCQVALAGQVGFRRAKGGRMAAREIEQPFDAFLDCFVMHVHGWAPGMSTGHVAG